MVRLPRPPGEERGHVYRVVSVQPLDVAESAVKPSSGAMASGVKVWIT